MPNGTAVAGFTGPHLTTFCHLDDLGLVATGQQIDTDSAVLRCRITADDSWCRRCGEQGTFRDTVTRRLAHQPFGWRPTTLLLSIRRYRCAGCQHVWRQDSSKAAEPRAKLSRRALRWALVGIVCQHLTMARVAEALGVSWSTANTAVLAEGKRVLIEDPQRFDDVTVIGVDEHVWRHTRRGDKHVTVIIDLTPIREKTGPARLLDMLEGRSKSVFKTWLGERDEAWRNGVEVVAMDGFTGYKTAAAEEIPAATAVMDTAADLLTDKQRARLNALFAVDVHVEVDVTWAMYQRAVGAYREPNRAQGRTAMTALITTLGSGVPKPLTELITLGRTFNRRAPDILAYFDRPGTSNGPTEAINGRLEHLRGSALGFRNPHQLHRQITAGNRRIQATTTPWIGMSQFFFARIFDRMPGYHDSFKLTQAGTKRKRNIDNLRFSSHNHESYGKTQTKAISGLREADWW